MILPIASLTWRGMDDARFAKAYQAKNVMRQMMISLASAVAVVALQHRQPAEHDRLSGSIDSGVDRVADMRAVFLAGQHLYLWIMALASWRPRSCWLRRSSADRAGLGTMDR